MIEIRATTILGVRHKGKVAMAGDGQITFGDMSFKQKAIKVREFKHAQNKVLGGFAGAAADALTLFEKFEQKLEQYEGDLKRATVELAKDWRMDKMLRHLDAMLVVMDLKKVKLYVHFCLLLLQRMRYQVVSPKHKHFFLPRR